MANHETSSTHSAFLENISEKSADSTMSLIHGSLDYFQFSPAPRDTFVHIHYRHDNDRGAIQTAPLG